MFDIQEQLKLLPDEPGVYLMKNKNDKIIYVGKAISLKNRVRQYFQSSKNHSSKVRSMVENIASFEYIITDSELEALILECNLIKQYRPKYNVLLRDDKTYPYIKVTVNEDYPRVMKVRRVLKDNAKYFGVPQNRERLFIIAWYKKLVDVDEFRFPYGIAEDGSTIYDKKKLKEGTLLTKVSDIFEPERIMDSQYTISDKMWEGHQKRKERNRKNGKGFGYSLFNADSTYTSTISARYWKDGSEILIDQSEKGLNPRVLTPVEAGRLQGYRIIGEGWEKPECANNLNYNDSNIEFKIVVSRKEAYRQFGNSVAIPVIKRLAEEIVKQLM